MQTRAGGVRKAFVHYANIFSSILVKKKDYSFFKHNGGPCYAAFDMADRPGPADLAGLY